MVVDFREAKEVAKEVAKELTERIVTGNGEYRYLRVRSVYGGDTYSTVIQRIATLLLR